MQILSGTEVASLVKERVQAECAQFIARTAVVPCLAVVLVGNDSASESYVASKRTACTEMGFKHVDYLLEASTTQAELLSVIASLNTDPAVHGILVQFPLPSHIDEQKVMKAIAFEKDVDGLHPTNLGNIVIGKPGLVPCTPAGVLRMLDHYGIDTCGMHAVIVGRSTIVGKPLAVLLMQKGRDATVTVCNTRTKDLKAITASADLLIAAMGKPAAITADMVAQGAVVIDVGINRVADPTKKRGYRIVGDVDYERVAPKCRAISPVPGGVGVITIAMLMANTLQACRMQCGECP